MRIGMTGAGGDDLFTPRPVPVKDGHADLSPDEALELLIEGNEAFVAGKTIALDLSNARRLELARGQAPFCAYVSCSDSRVPPELLFGRGLGELFIVRNAGNTVDTVALGSIEFAVAVLKVPLVVVMGHQACSAVKAAMDVVDNNTHFPGAIGPMVQPILPAVLATREHPGDPWDNAARENVRRTVRQLREFADPILSEPIASNRCKVVGAHYELSKGRVDFFDLG